MNGGREEMGGDGYTGCRKGGSGRGTTIERGRKGTLSGETEKQKTMEKMVIKAKEQSFSVAVKLCVLGIYSCTIKLCVTSYVYADNKYLLNFSLTLWSMLHESFLWIIVCVCVYVCARLLNVNKCYHSLIILPSTLSVLC